MHKATFILLLALSVSACTSYENKNRYEVSVNEKAEIYYSTNSCCFYCVSNERQLKHVKLVERKTVEPDPSDCAGCNYTAAFVFEAVSIGIDTVKLVHLTAGDGGCDSTNNNMQSENYIIEVK